MTHDTPALEAQLDAFDPAARSAALDTLVAAAAADEIALPPAGRAFNLHAHSFFSYNGYGYSPSSLAWRARRAGLYMIGLVDFDVLDGVDELLHAARRLNLRACAGLETRIYIPEFGDRVINSPGEPGISYHMAAGFTSGAAGAGLPAKLRAMSAERTRGLVARVNAYLSEIALDYDADLVPLTPAGNATERHVCQAYDDKARAVFAAPAQRAAYWSAKLGQPEEKIVSILDDGPALQALLRSKTMKAGGVGYVQPEGPDFPRLDEVNGFALANGAIPTLAWLDGCSAGEQAMDELLDLMAAAGTAAVNIIPDRNWNIAGAETRRDRVQRLHDFAARANARDMPIMAGTEMNAPGQRFVDDFDVPEMAPLYGAFRQGANILHAHTLLQSHAGLGYLSPWAAAHFKTNAEKNAFYNALGEQHLRIEAELSDWLGADRAPEEILHRLDIIHRM